MINYIEKGEGLGKYLESFGITLSEVYTKTDDGFKVEFVSNKPDEEVNQKIQEFNPWAFEKAKKFSEINNWLQDQVEYILSDIPKVERDSWPTQIAEARGLQPLSMLIGIALRRGIPVEDLIVKVLAKEKSFSDFYAEKQGERDRVETLVKSFPNEGDYHRLPELWALSCMA